MSDLLMKTNLNPKHILQQKMASTANDLCRLCAKKHDFLKDLLDENNKSILDLIKNFTQINVSIYYEDLKFNLLLKGCP